MVSSVSARYKLRLPHQLDPCSGTWLTPIPSVSFGLSSRISSPPALVARVAPETDLRERATCHSDRPTVTMSQSSILWALPVTSHKIVSPMPSFPNTVTTTSYAAMQADCSMLVGFLILEVRPRMLNWSCGKSSYASRIYMARRKATFSVTRQQKG